MINFNKFNSLVDIALYFDTPSKCKAAIVQSDAHMHGYIDEAVYRWNTRKLSESERFAQMFNKSVGIVRKWCDIRVGLMAA